MTRPQATELGALALWQGVVRRAPTCDEQFQRIFGCALDDYYYPNQYWGLDIVRFDKQVLRSDEQGISAEEAMLRRIVQAVREGMVFKVWPHDFAAYVYSHVACIKDDDKVEAMARKYAERLRALWLAGKIPLAPKATVQPSLFEGLL